MQHPSGIPEKIVNKVVARRGRLHAFETIDPTTTALVVIDLDAATVQNDLTSQRMISTVNMLARSVRASGGVVAWVLSRMTVMPKHFSAILGVELATRYFNDGHADGAGTKLWHELEPEHADVFAVKAGASAFFPGKCNLKEQLDARGIDTVLIAGTVTNICCESSARDAAELEYKVILISVRSAGTRMGCMKRRWRPSIAFLATSARAATSFDSSTERLPHVLLVFRSKSPLMTRCYTAAP